MLNKLDGFKTYIVCILGLSYAAIGFGMGWLDATQAMQFVQISLAAAGLRSAMK